MSATQNEIITALQSLDKTDDNLWTDDGSPRMDVLTAKLGKDLTRKIVNEALPGFSRNPDTTPAADTISQAAKDAYVLMAPPDDAPEDIPLPELDLDDPMRDKPLSRDELRALMKARIEQANDDIGDAQKAIRDANAGLIKAQQRHSRLVVDFNRRFPPLSAAQNIKQHLASQQAKKLAEAGISQVDRAMAQTRRHGWNRPTRPAAGAAA